MKTVTKKEIVAEMAAEFDLSQSTANLAINRLIKVVTAHLMAGERVRIPGLGIIEVVEAKARSGRHPATGEPITIPSRKRVKLRAERGLEDSVTGPQL